MKKIILTIVTLFFNGCGEITYGDDNTTLPNNQDGYTRSGASNLPLAQSNNPETMNSIEWKKSYSRIFREYTVMDSAGNFYSLYRVDIPHRAIISKLNPNGELVWEKSIYLNENLQASYVYNGEMKIDKDGNIYLVGSGHDKVDNLTSTNDLFQHAFVMKISPSGDKIWEYIENSIIRTYGEALSIDRNGNVYFIGRDENSKLSLIKLNKDGEKVFKKSYDSVSYNTMGKVDIILSKNNIYLLTKKSILKKKPLYIIKTSLNGIEKWSKSYKIQEDAYLLDTVGFEEDSNGDIILVSNKTKFVNNSMLYDINLLKINQYGTKLWEHTYGTDKVDKVRFVKLDNNNNIFVTGYTQGAFNGFENDEATLDTFLSKISPEGDVLKTDQIKTFGLSGMNVAGARFIGFNKNNNLFISGWGNIDNNRTTSSFLIKYK